MSDFDQTAEELTEEEIEQRRIELLEQEPLVRLFDGPANAKILTVLIDTAYDMSATSIARQADISRSTWYENRDLLLEMNLIKETREEAGAKFYNSADSEQLQKVVELADLLRPAATGSLDDI